MKYLKLIIKHLLGWICFILTIECESYIDGVSYEILIIDFISYIVLATLFYLLYFYINPKFLYKRKYIQFGISLISLFLFYNFERELELKYLHYIFPYLKYPTTINLKPISYFGIMLRSFTYFFYYVPFFIAFFVFKNSNILQKKSYEKDKLILLQKQEIAELHTANAKSQLAFLQSQINPHFLFNTLNSFYSKSVQLSADLAEGIDTLSQIMRYALQPNNGMDGIAQSVSLTDEIVHIENVTKIYKIRYKEKLNLNFTVSGNVVGIYIIPFVLITIVENMFKHGDVLSPETPATIALNVENGVLHFNTLNKIYEGRKEPGTGAGLPNIITRLTLTYKVNYTFNAGTNNGLYYTHLMINLNKNTNI